ncbi:MAG: PAS domain S-box protein [Gammaproteobacteria bacterium]|nr:PAS domain S-box protein [Gammaproteobacteria bacterium]
MRPTHAAVPSKQDLREEIERLRARVRELETDAAQRAEAETGLHPARSRLIVELAKDAIVCADGSERIVLFNRGAEETFGYTATQAIGQPLGMLLPERLRRAHSEHMRKFAESGERARFMGERDEIQAVRRDGSEFPAQASISVFRSGGQTYFAAVIRDITEHKEAEAALRRSEERLRLQMAELRDARERFEAQGVELVTLCEDLAQARDQAVYANHAKSQFLANMSHEIRTPLNAILGFSQLVDNEVFGPVSPPKYREYVQDIHVSGSHLLELINDILDLAKIEAGKLKIHDSEFEVAPAIEASLRFVKERAGMGGVRLGTEIETGLPVLRADERKVKQILVNLLSNAVKFTPSGGDILVRATIDGRDALRLDVCDTGVGIAAENLPKVLETFGQAHNAGMDVEEGTGLGLPLVKSMIELHGGTLDLQSTPDVGTTATIRFPPERLVRAASARVA